VEVILEHDLHLASQQTRVATVQLIEAYPKEWNATGPIGVVTPIEPIWTEKQCDFIEGYWTGESSFNIPFTNWRAEPIVLQKGSIVGRVDKVTFVDKGDPV